MRWATLACAACATLLAASCGDTDPVGSSSDFSARRLIETGKVVVRVHWEGEGIPGKRVELVELHLERETNEAGIAEFVVPAGDYTVRVYEINRGGPAMLYVDTEVTVTNGAKIRVEVVDCLPCV